MLVSVFAECACQTFKGEAILFSQANVLNMSAFLDHAEHETW